MTRSMYALLVRSFTKKSSNEFRAVWRARKVDPGMSVVIDMLPTEKVLNWEMQGRRDAQVQVHEETYMPLYGAIPKLKRLSGKELYYFAIKMT